jgi:hypothetical protein
VKRFAAAMIVATACAAGLSTDVAAQADTPPEYDYPPVMIHHPGMMCGSTDMV